jgi:AraC family transcriptional regulator
MCHPFPAQIANISVPFVMASIGPSEIMRPEETARGGTTRIRGGLPARKQKLVVEYIEQHLAEEISLFALARLAKLSPYHFSRAFRDSFGVPPHRYHMARRMNRAQDLLLRSALPVTQIGARIGFRETSSFTRAYRRYAGVSPSEYRRDRRGEPTSFSLLNQFPSTCDSKPLRCS